MGGYEYMVFDAGMMANVIATPQNSIVTNSDKGLDNIIFQNETIFADML